MISGMAPDLPRPGRLQVAADDPAAVAAEGAGVEGGELLEGGDAELLARGHHLAEGGLRPAVERVGEMVAACPGPSAPPPRASGSRRPRPAARAASGKVASSSPCAPSPSRPKEAVARAASTAPDVELAPVVAGRAGGCAACPRRRSGRRPPGGIRCCGLGLGIEDQARVHVRPPASG